MKTPRDGRSQSEHLSDSEIEFLRSSFKGKFRPSWVAPRVGGRGCTVRTVQRYFAQFREEEKTT